MTEYVLDGNYTVQSSYNCQHEVCEKNDADGPNIWKLAWSAVIQAKVKKRYVEAS